MRPNKICIVFLVVFYSAISIADTVFDTNKLILFDGHLSPLWAQEYIGADLVHDELKPSDWKSRTPVYVYDSSGDDHAVPVARLISGAGNISIIQNEYPLILDQDHIPQSKETWTTLKNNLSKLEVQPSYLNLSFPLRIDSNVNLTEIIHPEITNVLDGILNAGVIPIVSAGNEGLPVRDISPTQYYLARKNTVISVGSLSPFGGKSNFSNFSSFISVYAPADSFLYSMLSNNQPALFGGTSGATPLVTGALALFEGISGFRLKLEQAKTILKRTSIKQGKLFLKNQELDAGMLNVYKIFHVAKRLAQRCGHDYECLNTELNSAKTYIFETSNSNKPQSLKDLRRNALLVTSADGLWKQVAEKYLEKGFTINALYYLSLCCQSDLLIDELRAHLSTKNNLLHHIQYNKYLLNRSLNENDKTLFFEKADLFASNMRSLSEHTSYLSQMGSTGFNILLKLLSSNDYETRKIALWNIQLFQSQEADSAIKTVLHDKDYRLRKNALFYLMLRRKNDTKVLKNALLSDPHPEVREYASYLLNLFQ